MKPVVYLARFCHDGTERAEIAEFVAWAAMWQLKNPDIIRDLQIAGPYKGICPTPCARNRAVYDARKAGADVLMMLDANDMCIQPRFFAEAVKFLANHPGPAAIGSPYGCAPPSEDTLVFEWASFETGSASAKRKLERIRREDAARRTGIERVASIGTGCICFDLRCFDVYGPPYFDYRYNGPEMTSVVETEDCFAIREMSSRGIPIYCHWDVWSGHWKEKLVPKPEAATIEDIGRAYIEQAKAELRKEAADKAKAGAQAAGNGAAGNGAARGSVVDALLSRQHLTEATAGGYDPSVVFCTDPQAKRPDAEAIQRFEAQLRTQRQGAPEVPAVMATEATL